MKHHQNAPRKRASGPSEAGEAQGSGNMPIPHGAPSGKVRLQRFLADSGVASRRQCEALILEGQVVVNNAVVQSLPAFIDPERDTVIARGVRVRPQRPEYYLVHKPKGVVCTNNDPAGRTRAVDLLPPLKTRLFVVGRLDEESEGLLLMTNDGELAARVTHPRYGVVKVYRAEVRGQVAPDLPDQLRKGVWLSDGKVRVQDSKIIHADRQHSMIEIVAPETPYREIRRMFARIGHPVRRLKRIRIGPLSLAGLPRGAARKLAREELEALRAEISRPAAPRRQRAKGTRSRQPAQPRPQRDRKPENTGRPPRPPARAVARTAASRPPRSPGSSAETAPKRRVIT